MKSLPYTAKKQLVLILLGSALKIMTVLDHRGFWFVPLKCTTQKSKIWENIKTGEGGHKEQKISRKRLVHISFPNAWHILHILSMGPLKLVNRVRSRPHRKFGG
jgi:hypothetical protein